MDFCAVNVLSAGPRNGSWGRRSETPEHFGRRPAGRSNSPPSGNTGSRTRARGLGALNGRVVPSDVPASLEVAGPPDEWHAARSGRSLRRRGTAPGPGRQSATSRLSPFVAGAARMMRRRGWSTSTSSSSQRASGRTAPCRVSDRAKAPLASYRVSPAWIQASSTWPSQSTAGHWFRSRAMTEAGSACGTWPPGSSNTTCTGAVKPYAEAGSWRTARP
jgi:hypothetical protein